MPSAETMLKQCRTELNEAQCAGMAGVHDTFRLTKIYCALLRMIGPPSSCSS